MIRLDRKELLDLASNVILANTPYSLYHAIVKTSAFGRMKRECSPQQLEQYYDKITERPRRTEIELGITYCVLLVLLTADNFPNAIDASRLLWGEAIKELIQKSGRATQSIIIAPSVARPTLLHQQSPGSRGLF